MADDRRFALIFEVESALQRTLNGVAIARRLRRRQIQWVLLQTRRGSWLALDADLVAARIGEDEDGDLLEWFKDAAQAATPDFREGTLRIAGRSQQLAFLASGIRLPGKPPPGPRDEELYVCDAHGHRVRRPPGSTGSLCGVALKDGTSCPGTLRIP